RQFSAAASQTMKAVKSVEKAAANLADATRRAWGSITRPAQQHGLRLSEQIIETSGSLAINREDASYEELRKFEERSLQAIRIIVKTYNKYVVSVVRSAKPETSALEDSIARLSRAITDLTQTLDRSNLKQLQIAARESDQLARSVRELRLKIDRIQDANQRLGGLQEKESNLSNDISLLSGDQNLRELGRIEEQIRRKEQEVLALLEPLSKPLRKANRPESKAPAGLTGFGVSRLVDNPLTAILETPVAEMHGLLSSLHQLIEKDELFLDQRRKRKSIEAIETLEAGLLERFREDHAILQANRREVLRQLKGSGIYDKWMSLKSQLDDTLAEAADCRSLVADLQSQEAKLRALINSDKAKIEAVLEEILNERVSISLSF
ncbi:MAG: hypothetical protein WCC94_11355, partial [Candidatus Bathyarchaeia archaeon]